MASNIVEFTKATLEDAFRISEIFNANILTGNSTLWQRTFSEEDIKSILNNFSPRECAYILRAGKETIGWGWIRKYHDKEGYSKTCETSVFLDPNYVNQGFGSPFKKFILEECAKLGYHHIHAKIMATNKISIAYNLKLGYTIVGTQSEVGFKDGKWIDVVIMQKLL